jgi:arginine N-succinyltransferase
MLLRYAQESDLSSIYQLVKQRGVGMTTLPSDINILESRLAWAAESFKKSVNMPEHEYYLFVMENTATQEILGTSAIDACLGSPAPFYSYRLSHHTQSCDFLNIRCDYQMLNLVNDNHGRSELCTLFLDPMHRHQQNGCLLSRGRFLFMANFPERIADTVIAEMRGVSDKTGRSTFWDSLGQHFFNMSFDDADCQTLIKNKQFIADLMPKHPIYVHLLTKEAQAVIGKAHHLTQTALTILQQEGFKESDYIDIFDAGPTLQVMRNDIKTIRTSCIMTVQGIMDNMPGKQVLLSNTEPNFRATVAHILINEHEQSCLINKKTAELLQVDRFDKIRIHSQEHL